jgi:putative ABC transport system ATP-binding protein
MAAVRRGDTVASMPADAPFPALQARGLAKVFGQGPAAVRALRGVDASVADGEFVAIMGPSGSGKSTLLHILGALDRPTAGSVSIHGRRYDDLPDRELTRLRGEVFGFVFQFFNLLPTLTAAENVALPLLLGGRPRGRALKDSAAALDRVGLPHRADHFPEEMSGGEMQRVAIARALVTEPDAVLCDEPTGNLDSATSAEVLQLLRRLPESGRRSVVMVTHDRTAADYGDRLVQIRDGLLAGETAPRRAEWSIARG